MDRKKHSKEEGELCLGGYTTADMNCGLVGCCAVLICCLLHYVALFEPGDDSMMRALS
jgi:hypothetical protein